jgi:hypothetical protein
MIPLPFIPEPIRIKFHDAAIDNTGAPQGRRFREIAVFKIDGTFYKESR